MVFDLLDTTATWQKIFKMPSPAGWVLALAEAMGFGPIQDYFDPTANTARRLRLNRPDRLQHSHDKPSVDRLNGQGTEYGRHVSSQSSNPLCSVLAIAPSDSVRGHISVCATSKVIARAVASLASVRLALRCSKGSTPA